MYSVADFTQAFENAFFGLFVEQVARGADNLVKIRSFIVIWES